MQSRTTQIDSMLPEHDVKILISLYEQRAMSTEQIARRHNYTMWTIYKKINKLRKNGYILTHSIKGYTPGKRRQGDYHRISSKGVSLLKTLNYPVEHEADTLRVNQFRLPYLLSTNDLLIDMEHYGWDVTDSREFKERHELNRGNNIQGALISPEGNDYPFYIFIRPLGLKSISKIKQEISSYDFADMIMFTKSKDSFKQVMDVFGNNSDIVKYRTFRVFPYLFAKYYLRKFDNPQEFMRYMGRYSVTPVETNNYFSLPDGLRTVVEYNGEQRFFVNLLDNDLKKIYHIKNYRKESYEQDGRKVLVATNMKKQHETMLQHIHHVEYLEVSNDDLLGYLR